MTSLVIKFRGALSSLSPESRNALLHRREIGGPAEGTLDLTARVEQILQRVQEGKDSALHAMAKEFDRVSLESLEVPRASIKSALDRLNAPLREVMETAIGNISTVHRAFLPVAQEVEVFPGLVVGRRPDPLGRVGVYAPGGRAAYPSSVLMGVIPAKVAKVREVVLCSPPSPSGLPSDVVLAAAALSEVDRVFALGGAGAIAAMAYGTESVPRVQLIVGPGNAYVAEAKRQVSGTVLIDMPAGPSELLAIADETADPEAVAREMLAQAEHDPDAAVVTLALSAEVARAIEEAVGHLTPSQKRKAIVDLALSRRGAILTVTDLEEAVAFANDFAAEHLLLAVKSPQALLPQLKGAGTVLLGETSSVAFGDYLTGANHVLPTAGLGHAFSGLSTLNFFRWTSYQQVSRVAATQMADPVGRFADAEGLSAHAEAARYWRQR